MSTPQARKVLGFLGREFERLLLAGMALTFALAVYHGYGRLQALLDSSAPPPPPPPKITQFYNDLVAWRFLEPPTNADLGARHACMTVYPPEWLRPIKPTAIKPPDNLPDAGIAVTAEPPPVPMTVQDPLGTPIETIKLTPPEPGAGGATATTPGGGTTPGVKPPAAPKKNYLQYQGFMKSPNNHLMAYMVQSLGSDFSGGFLEVGGKFGGMTVISADKYKIVLRKDNGEKITLNVGERLEVKEPMRPATPPKSL